MNARSVVIVEPYSSGNMLAPAFRREGFLPYAVTRKDRSAPIPTSLRVADFEEHLVFDGNDMGPLVEQLRPMAPSAIIPGTDTGVLLADQLAAIMTPHLANAPGLASARHHKGDMVAAVRAHGLPAIKTLCTDSFSEIENWILRQGLSGKDLVIKPSDSIGTDRVTFVPGGREWRGTFARIIGATDRYGDRIDDVVLQEYVTGTEYVVDTFSYEGRHTVNDIARYRKVSNQRHMAIYESMEILPFDQPGHRELVTYVKQVLDAVGIRFGAAHTEVMLTDHGPLLIEVNARLSGGGQPWACQLATGDNVIDRMVRYLLGHRNIRDDYTREMAVLVIFFAAQSAGIVSNLSHLEAIEDLDSCFNVRINVREGDYVPETADIFDAQNLGTVVLAHSDPEQIRADHLAVRTIASRAGRPEGLTIDPPVSHLRKSRESRIYPGSRVIF
jgi:biotin carboxylase